MKAYFLREQRQKLLDPETGEPAQESPRLESTSVWYCPSLSYQERVIGCATCFLLGFLLSVGSSFRLAKLVRGNPAPFAIAYTIGNVLSLGCTTFFVGPWKQVETMLHAKRRVSAIVYVVFIVVTLVLCFAREVHHRVLLVLLSVLIQFLTLVWYTLSYVPYGRRIALSCCKRMCFGLAGDEEL